MKYLETAEVFSAEGVERDSNVGCTPLLEDNQTENIRRLRSCFAFALQKMSFLKSKLPVLPCQEHCCDAEVEDLAFCV